MGRSFSTWLRKRLIKEHRAKIIILGLDAAGKTTLTSYLKRNEFSSPQPTVGQNIEVIRHRNWNLTAIDVAGQRHFRFLWDTHYTGVSGVIFVVDASDAFRFEEARAVMIEHLFENEHLKQAPILILANKQDLPGAVPAVTLIQALGLHIDLSQHTFQIFGCSILHGNGIEESLDWLISRME